MTEEIKPTKEHGLKGRPSNYKGKGKRQIEARKLKDKILTDLYLQRPPFDKDNLWGHIIKMCRKVGLNDDSFAYEDIYQVVFLELSKKPAEYIIQLYEQGRNPKRLRALALKIAILKGFANDDKYPGLPSHSAKNMLLHTSNFNINNNLGQDIFDWNDDGNYFLIDESPLPDNVEPDTWGVIAKHLTVDELATVKQELYGKKIRGRTKRNEEHYRNLSKVKEKIKRIVEENNIDV